MSTHLSRFFRQRREACRIGLGELARRCGYRNVTKGANRIQTFEFSGRVAPQLIVKLTSILGITSDEIRRCVDQDRADWERMTQLPIEPYLVVRLMPGFYLRTAIPTEIQQDRR